ncbi:hypothetical protein BDW60DRAFT_212781 [Aspergillus nidulans var. acristatus]
MGRDLRWLWACLVLAMHGRGALVTLVWLYTSAALAPHQVGLGLGSHLVLPWRRAVVGSVWVLDWWYGVCVWSYRARPWLGTGGHVTGAGWCCMGVILAWYWPGLCGIGFIWAVLC